MFEVTGRRWNIAGIGRLPGGAVRRAAAVLEEEAFVRRARDRLRGDARRDVGAAEGVPELPLVLLRPLAEPLGHLVLDAALREPAEDAGVPQAQEHVAVVSRGCVSTAP